MFKLFILSNATLRVGGDDVRMMVWDTAGQEEFDTITRAYYRWETTQNNHKSLLLVADHKKITRAYYRWYTTSNVWHQKGPIYKLQKCLT